MAKARQWPRHTLSEGLLMGLALHLGVVDIPYQAPGKSKSTTTTGDVAEILEAKYHVMRLFFELHGPFCAKALEKGLAGALEHLLMGAPTKLDPFAEGAGQISDRFKQFLNNREIERLGYPGVPTKAALKGVNHRFAHPYAKANKRRPSFIDTTLYQDSMRAWVDGKV